jgi:hypothetical protein
MAKKSDSAPAANLTCGQCGYENEAERVYCHNCGAKLDRSLLPKEEEKTTKTETPEQARKRIKKMTNPQTGGAMREVKTAIHVLIYSVLVAMILLLIQKPDDVPEVSKELTQRFVSSEMMELVDAPQPRRVDFTEAEINAHLKQSLKAKEGALPGMEFTRAYVNLLPGAIRIGNEQSFFGLPHYSSVIYRLDVKDGKFTPTLLGGNFGRLAVHPAILGQLDFFFKNLWAAFQKERKQMDKMQTIIVQKGTITLVSKGGAPQ